jgi:hypothetical protein
MSAEERAVIEAARKCFGTRTDTETDVVYLDSAVSTWNAAALADAIRRLDGYPRHDPTEGARARTLLAKYEAWRAAR